MRHLRLSIPFCARIYFATFLRVYCVMLLCCKMWSRASERARALALAHTLNFDELIDLVPKNDDKYAGEKKKKKKPVAQTVDDRTFIHISQLI